MSIKMTAKEVQENRKQILEAGMTDREKKWFDKLYGKYPMKDTAMLIVTAKDMAADEELTENNAKAQEKLYDLEQRKEACAFKYLNEKTDINDSKTRQKVLQAFYKSDDPESLMKMSINDVIKTLKSA